MGNLGGLLLIAAVTVGQPPGQVTSLPRPNDLPMLPPPSSMPLAPTFPSRLPPVEVPHYAIAPEPPSVRALDRYHELRRRTARTASEALLIFPAVYQRLEAPLNVGGLYTTTARLPSAPLNVNGVPEFRLRFSTDDLGDFGIVYRLYASDGRDSVVGFDPAGPASLRSRLDMHILDINYYTPDEQVWFGWLPFLDREFDNKPRWGMTWDMGARMTSTYFDSRAVGAFLDRRITNHFFGAGPHVGMELTRSLGFGNWSLYTRFDSAVMVGTVTQQFSELASVAGVPMGFGYNSQRGTQAVPMISTQVGVNLPPFLRMTSFQLGYQFEQFWAIGTTGNSSGSIMTHGLFARWTRSF